LVPLKGIGISWATLVNENLQPKTRVIFTKPLDPALGETANILKLEHAVGDLLLQTATTLGHTAEFKQIRVEHTYVVRIKETPPKNIRMVVNLFTETAIKIVEALPLRSPHLVLTPNGDYLNLTWPDRPRTEAFIISNAPTTLDLDVLINHLKTHWDLDTLSLGHAPTRGNQAFLSTHTLLGVFTGTNFSSHLPILDIPNDPTGRSLQFRRITLPPPPPPPRQPADSSSAPPSFAALVAQPKSRPLSTAEAVILPFLVTEPSLLARYRSPPSPTDPPGSPVAAGDDLQDSPQASESSSDQPSGKTPPIASVEPLSSSPAVCDLAADSCPQITSPSEMISTSIEDTPSPGDSPQPTDDDMGADWQTVTAKKQRTASGSSHPRRAKIPSQRDAQLHDTRRISSRSATRALRQQEAAPSDSVPPLSCPSASPPVVENPDIDLDAPYLDYEASPAPEGVEATQ